jgi:RsiW-degrading membrane proteinase PrsW (M82 family)
LPQRSFPFDQQAEPLAVFKGAALGIGFQFLESFGHALQAKLTQQIQCRMLQHGRYSPQWK